MEVTLVNVEFFREGEGGAKRLQTILAAVIAKAITGRINEEMTRCASSRTGSHWVQNVLPDRLTMSLRRPSCDKLLQESRAEEFQKCINTALFDEDDGKHSLVLYFEILERHALLKRIRNTGSRRSEDYAMMVFYESASEDPDERLQKILNDVLKGAEPFAQVK